MKKDAMLTFKYSQLGFEERVLQNHVGVNLLQRVRHLDTDELLDELHPRILFELLVRAVLRVRPAQRLEHGKQRLGVVLGHPGRFARGHVRFLR